MAEDKVKNFITVFDETINNCDRINTPEEITKTFESLQRVTDELLTEDNLVIDPDTLMRYNNFLANEAVTDNGKLSKIDENFFNYSSYPSCFNGKSGEEIITSINSKLGSYAREVKIFGCLRGFLSFDIWKYFNSIEEWYSKELNDENSITNHVIKYFKLLESFYKLLNSLNESFIKGDEKCDERAEVENMIEIQVRTVKSLREGVYCLSESNSDKDMVELTRRAANELSSFPSQVGDLEPFLVKHYYN